MGSPLPREHSLSIKFASKVPVKYSEENSLFVGHGQISKVLSPLSVDVVLEPLVDEVETCETGSFWMGLCCLRSCTYWVIRIQLGAIHQHTVSAVVQVWNLLWEPGYLTHVWEEREGKLSSLVMGFEGSAEWFNSPSLWRQELSRFSMSSTFTFSWSSWMISFSCSWLLSQSTKISNSELRLLDFLDSMCTRLTWFSWRRHSWELAVRYSRCGAHSRMDAGTKKEIRLQFNHSFLVVFVRKLGKKGCFGKNKNLDLYLHHVLFTLDGYFLNTDA